MTAKIEKIRKMQHIWETQVKPHVEDLMGKEDGQYAAMVLVAHGCEHAYKAIRKPKKRNVMQESLESVLRLNDLLQADSSGRPINATITKHWGRITAHELRAFIVNPWKHKGMLKGGKTELINDPHGGLGGYSVSLSGLRDVRPPVIDELKIAINAHHYVKMLVSGMDSAYALFLDESSPSQHKEWFSPAQCSTNKRCHECGMELFPCERCEEELEFVGVKIRCMCDENSESIREAIRWIRHCEKYCTGPTYPKHLKDTHFLLSDDCLFSSVCREINQVLVANCPDGYVAGTHTEGEIRDIMRPLREGVDKCLTELERTHAQRLNSPCC